MPDAGDWFKVGEHVIATAVASAVASFAGALIAFRLSERAARRDEVRRFRASALEESLDIFNDLEAIGRRQHSDFLPTVRPKQQRTLRDLVRRTADAQTIALHGAMVIAAKGVVRVSNSSGGSHLVPETAARFHDTQEAYLNRIEAALLEHFDA